MINEARFLGANQKATDKAKMDSRREIAGMTICFLALKCHTRAGGYPDF